MSGSSEMEKAMNRQRKFVLRWLQTTGENIKNSFRIGPYVSILLNVMLVCLLSLYTNDNAELLEQGLHMSDLVSSASISIVTLTFSLTVLSVQIAAQSYSPRLLEEFIRDPVAKSVISVNLGSYSYCYCLSYFLFDTSRVPVVAIHFLSFQMFLVLFSFVRFLHFFISGFRLENILKRARDSCLKAAIAVATMDDDDVVTKEDFPEIGNNAYKVFSDKSGYITRFQLDNIVLLAQEMDVFVRYNRRVGEYVAENTILAYVWDAQTKDGDEDTSLEQRIHEYILKRPLTRNPSNHASTSWDDLAAEDKLGVFVMQGVVMDTKRTGDADVTLGIQQLSDTAMRALSPGINDPQTAIQCMDVLSEVLGRLASMKLAFPHAYDEHGILRVCAPRTLFSYFLSMLDPIRHYGSSDLAVCRRGIRLFGDLGFILAREQQGLSSDRRIQTVLDQMEAWLSVAKENFVGLEMKSLQALYDHELEIISDSRHSTAKEVESVDEDPQELELTHAHEE